MGLGQQSEAIKWTLYCIWVYRIYAYMYMSGYSLHWQRYSLIFPMHEWQWWRFYRIHLLCMESKNLETKNIRDWNEWTKSYFDSYMDRSRRCCLMLKSISHSIHNAKCVTPLWIQLQLISGCQTYIMRYS